MILAPSGSLARKNVLVLSARQMSWFMDPEALLRHIGEGLKAVGVAVYCKRCYERGLKEEVTARFLADKNAWEMHCGCSDYPLLHVTSKGLMARRTNEDGTEKKHWNRSVDELLWRCNWALKCTEQCARLGMHDGVEGNNDGANGVLKVVCGCTERVYTEPSSVN